MMKTGLIFGARICNRMNAHTWLNQLSVDEKIAQLCCVNAASLVKDRKVDPIACRDAFAHGIGMIHGCGGSGGVIVGAGTVGGDYHADEILRFHQELQELLISIAPQPIPAIFSEESLSGYQQIDATVYPQALNLASTWRPEGVRRMADQIRKLMRGAGVHQSLSPVLDLVHDPRWGRCEETYGEDPHLAAAMACAYVGGLQSDDLKQGVAATLKHFLAYGLSEGGRNLAPLRAGERQIRDEYLPVFAAAIKAGAASIMSAYSDLDGEVITSSKKWLTDVLRGELGFEGTVVCDFGALDMLQSIFCTAESPAEAAFQAFKAGIDVEMPAGHTYRAQLKGLLDAGRIEMSELDERVLRVLRLKERLGLLDPDPIRISGKAEDFDSPEQRALARELAVDGITLLQNRSGILPLTDPPKRILICGPNAETADALLGDYSYTGGRRGFWWKRMVKPDLIDEVKATSIADAFAQVLPETSFLTRLPGCSRMGGDSDERLITQAAAAAARHDLAVIVAGESSMDLSGECRDRGDIGLPGKQEDLIHALAASGTPVVLILLNGRPLDLSRVHESCDAILEAWYPGDEGGHALADILLGHAEPGGRLPVTFPAHANLFPFNSRLHANSGWEKNIEGQRPCALYAFGHGLSYTRFAYRNLDVSVAADQISVQFDLENSGPRVGEEVVQVYVHDPVSSMVRPDQDLKAFDKVRLKPGENRRITLSIPLDSLAFHDRDLNRTLEPGRYEIRVGASSTNLHLKGWISV
jgi:beta-glucosidase